MKIQNKILTAFGTTLLITFFIMSGMTYRNINNHFIDDIDSKLEKITITVASWLEKRSNTEFEQLIRPSLAQINPLVNQAIVIVDKSDLILYSTHPRFRSGDVFEGEVKEKNIAHGQRKGLTLNNRNYLAQVRSFTLVDLQEPYEIISLVDLTEVEVIVKKLFLAQVRGMAVISLFALAIGVYLARSLVKPLIELKDYANRIPVSGTNKHIKIDTKDEIGELTNTVNKLANRLYEYDKSQKTLLQNVSHELKSPLMSIQGYAEGIKDGVIEGKEITESLDIIVEESQRLKKLVNEIIYLSKLETKEEFYSFSTVDLKEILFSSVEKIRGEAINKGLTFRLELEESCIIEGDEDKLTQAFINVLSNTIRYCQREVSIQLESSPRPKITIIDDGKGFSEPDLKNLFTRFYKGEKGQTGLGLTITQVIIERHKGTIKAENHKQGGALFTITFYYSSS